MEDKVQVEFVVPQGRQEEFLQQLQRWTSSEDSIVLGYRADDQVARRAALAAFVNEMELVLRRHDHKTSWRERPIDALIRLMLLELEEFKVAYEHFEVKEARKELVDLSNYCLIVYDRLSLLDQERNAKEQQR